MKAAIELHHYESDYQSAVELKHEAFNLFYLEKGTVNIEMCSAEHITDIVIDPGSFITLPISDNRKISFGPNSSYYHIALTSDLLTGSYFSPLLQQLTSTPVLTLLNPFQQLQILTALRQIKSAPTSHPFYQYLIGARVIDMLCSFIFVANQDQNYNTITAGVLQYIETHIEKAMTLDDIAESLYISKYHMSHIFKKDTGIAVGEAVLTKKMKYAELLLLNGLTAHQVCSRIGFNSYSAFFRIYKRIIGCTPQDTISKHKPDKRKL